LRDDIKKNIEHTKCVCHFFAQELEKMGLSYYYQHYPINSPAVFVMQALGFKTAPRTTYRIEDTSNLEKIVQSFSKNKKRQLQKAESLYAKLDMNIEDFYRFHVKCLQSQGKQISYTREFLLVLERKAHRLNQSQIISICDASDQVLAAAFLVWDHQNMYYLIPCYDPVYRASGASARLVLESIKLAQQKGIAFDFEGSMIKGIAEHYKQFGSTATCYYCVEKYYKWYFWFANLYNRIRQR
jgi:lipid II:glycine glycyltransferase (peptidoglycan interpeptide bridge formation enzyme)